MCMWNDSVSGEWTRFSDKLYWPRRWNSTRAEYLSKFSLPPSPPSTLSHSPVISPRVSVGQQKEQAGKKTVSVVLETRKETTNAPSRFNPENGTVFFSLSNIQYLIILKIILIISTIVGICNFSGVFIFSWTSIRRNSSFPKDICEIICDFLSLIQRCNYSFNLFERDYDFQHNLGLVLWNVMIIEDELLI